MACNSTCSTSQPVALLRALTVGKELAPNLLRRVQKCNLCEHSILYSRHQTLCSFSTPDDAHKQGPHSVAYCHGYLLPPVSLQLAKLEGQAFSELSRRHTFRLLPKNGQSLHAQ